MLSSAVVVFREVFEIVLIVGIVLAATRSMPHRGKAILLGFAGGIAGSALVALFTGQISNLAEGLGQEYFNAGILFTAALFIGWTVLWMKRHARELKSRFQTLGQNVADGTVSYFALSMVIAVTMLREGSEIVLFTYGMLASGQSLLSIVSGAAVGLVGGTLVGVLLYMGLIRISLKYFFRITSALLILLVAGMMSQAIGLLTAAGAFETLSFTVWDSSWILGEDGLIGQSLKTLIGYTAQPSAIQIIVYTLTLGILFMLLNFFGKAPSRTSGGVAAAFLIGALVLIPAPAQATKSITSPYVEKGELELEWKGGYDVDEDSAVDGGWKQKAGVGYGLTDYWFMELALEAEKSGAGGDADLTAIEWENKFQLTNPGEYWADLGAVVELVHSLEDNGADKAEVKLLAAKDTGKFTHKVNVIAEREFGDNAGDETEFALSLGSRYRYSDMFEPGIEMYNEFGSLSDGSGWDGDKHRIGPAAYGQIGSMKYDVGYLFGISEAAPDGLVKVILEYEWHF